MKRVLDVFDAEATPSTTKRAKRSEPLSGLFYCVNAEYIVDLLSDKSPGAASRCVQRGALLIARVTNFVNLGEYCLFTCTSADTLLGGAVYEFEVVLGERTGKKAAKALNGHIDASSLPNMLHIALDGGVAGQGSAKAAFRITYSQGVQFQFGALRPVEFTYRETPSLPSFSFDPVSPPTTIKSEPADEQPSHPISHKKGYERMPSPPQTVIRTEKMATPTPLVHTTPVQVTPFIKRSSNKCSSMVDAISRAKNAQVQNVYADIIVEVVALPGSAGNIVDVYVTDYSTAEDFYPDPGVGLLMQSAIHKHPNVEDLATKLPVAQVGFFAEYATVARGMSVGEVYHLRNIAFRLDNFNGGVKGRVCYYPNDGMRGVTRVKRGEREGDAQYKAFRERKQFYAGSAGTIFNTPHQEPSSSRPKTKGHRENKEAEVTVAPTKPRKSVLDD